MPEAARGSVTWYTMVYRGILRVRVSALVPHRTSRKGSGGVIFCSEEAMTGALLRPEPTVKQAFAFIDGQNLFYAA